MDNRQNVSLHDLFSRGSTPPPMQSSQSQQYPGPIPHNAHNVSPTNQIDSLFQQLSSSSPSGHQQHTSQSNDEYSNSMPNTPVMSISDEPSSISSTSAADRQSALLSLLGGASASASVSNTVGSVVAGPQLPQQQIPSPPGSSQRSGTSPSHSETQGKILLEQLMAGQPPRSNYSDSQRNTVPDTSSTPPYASTQHESEYRPYGQHDPAIELARGPQVPQQTMQQPYQPHAPLSSQQQNQPPSPRKSMFDFVSPFDALSSSGPAKKKQIPPSNVSSGNEDTGWTSVSAPDPKRQSVDNLLETLARAQIIQPPPSHSVPQAQAAYDPYGEYTQSEQVQSRVPPPPLPPKPSGVSNRAGSPRASPPKTQAQRARVVESPASQQGSSGNSGNRRDKESSPGPATRGSVRGKGKFNKNVNSPSPQAQNIVFDVSQSLEEIQAPPDSVKSTAIALVRQDSVFLPGTTIGATHWVAYAMTRGRIRVISRSSGDRTLLQLPSVFPSGVSVTDMAVYGNRLAGVTSDGGFVVWELPETITDDVPGQLLLCIAPPSNQEALQSVKWHPKEPDTLAVASESQIYLIDLANAPALRGQILPQSDLVHIGQVFPVSSTLVAFDFDVLHYALATISTDSTLTIWNIQDQLPYSTHKVRGEDVPSSLTFVEGGIVVGRKNGTIVQLLSITTKAVLSTVKFVNGTQEDPEMFGHVSYDSRIQTLWVANCRRESMIALRINLETSVNSSGEEAYRGYFEQVIEFAGPKSTIHFVILTADADPNGDEAYAACVAAKVPPGELALVAFSVHSSGVDQILIRKEWFDAAVSSTRAKYPTYALPPSQISLQQPQSSQPNQESTRAQRAPQSQVQQQHQAPARLRTPPSEEIEADMARDEGRQETKSKGKGKNVNFEKNSKSADNAIINESALGQALSKEIRKTEENLHTRIGRLLGKEMDKQHQRLEEARAHEQAEDFARQEKILKLISTELTRNTTRVVEAAVKSEVQNSVLPSLENITKNEVKAALNDQVGRGLVDFISQSLPVELEKLLLRSDISGHFSHILSTNLTPLIDRHVKEAVNKTLIPVYSQQSSAMHQELLREIRNEIHSFKSELTGWQSDTLRNQENSIRELERTVRMLSDQVKFLSMSQTGSALHHIQQPPTHNSPGSNMPQNPMTQPHMRQPNITASLPSSSSTQISQVAPPSYNLSAQAHFPPPQTLQSQWYAAAPPIAAPQASHPVLPPPAAHPQPERSPSIPAEQWDETYLGVLHTQDTTKLRELLSRTNPELIMPLNGKALVSQAVILTLVHRLSAIIGEVSPTDESFKTSLWWLQRSVVILHPEDKLITDFIPRVIPNVQMSLNTTKQRLAIPVPGGPPTLDIARTISDIQETLRRKVSPIPLT